MASMIAAALRSRSSQPAEALTVGLLVFVCLISGIGMTPILNGDEARFAQASREMLLNGDYVVPTFGGHPRYDKPILIYWVTAASFRIFGVTPGAARLPSAISAALCAALLAWSARRRWGPGSGVAAGLLLAASPIFFFEGRTCTADSLNLLWTVAAMLMLEHLLIGHPNRWTAAAFWIFTGLAVLTKGPVAPLFIGSTLVGLWAFARSWKAWEIVAVGALILAGALFLGPSLMIIPAVATVVSALKRSKIRRRQAGFRWGWGIPLFLAITLPWAIAAWRATSGEFFAIALGRHVLERGQSALEGHSGFPGFYLATAVILCFPWLAVALKAGSDAWHLRREDPDRLFLLAWALGPLITLEMVQTQLVHYWLPSYPALILLAVGWLWTVGNRTLAPGFRMLHLLGGLLLAAIPVIPVLVFGLPGLRIPAVGLTLFLVAVTLVTSSTVTHRSFSSLAPSPGGSLWISAGGTLLFLTLLFGPFLSRFSDSWIGPRATAVAQDSLKQGRRVLLYGLRDEEMLFSLPLNTTVSPRTEKLSGSIANDRSTVFCAREKDFRRRPDLGDSGHFEVIDRVQGIDLGRGRMATTVFFRVREGR